MIRKMKGYIFLVLCLLFRHQATATVDGNPAGLFLFSSHEYCASGDTVWFKVFQSTEAFQKSNIVHLQLISSDNRVITSVISGSKEALAEGYIHVPDSLGTGVYFLAAFQKINGMKGETHPVTRSLFVYNRFSETITSLEVPRNDSKVKVLQLNSSKVVLPEKNVYAARDRVRVTILPDLLREYGVQQYVVRAARTDVLAAERGGYFQRSAIDPGYAVPGFVEKDGVLISGTVTHPETGEPAETGVVFLSLLNDPLYFDYCITNQAGRFDFFLKDAVGTGEIVLQALSENSRNWNVSLHTGSFRGTNPLLTESVNLSPEQSDFISETVDAAYYARFFGDAYEVKVPHFSMPRRFNFPVYGKPYDRVVPAEYYDLPDFQEVSRELLHGVKHRSRGDDHTIRLLNLGAAEYFNEEPLRLINGIPVFDNNIFASMGSDEIDSIDYVLEDRIYGDLRFSGVLALYLNPNAAGWLSEQTNLFRFTVPLLQPERTFSFSPDVSAPVNIPDFRQVYYWQVHDAGIPLIVEFMLSDLKGKVTVTVEGVTADGEIFQSTEILEVK